MYFVSSNHSSIHHININTIQFYTKLLLSFSFLFFFLFYFFEKRPCFLSCNFTVCLCSTQSHLYSSFSYNNYRIIISIYHLVIIFHFNISLSPIILTYKQQPTPYSIFGIIGRIWWFDICIFSMILCKLKTVIICVNYVFFYSFFFLN